MRYNFEMFLINHVILLLLFILKLVEHFKFYTLRFTQSHFRTQAKIVFKKLEINLEKRKQDIKLTRFCLIYQLCPKFTKFKLH